MPEQQTITRTVYTFAELNDRAKDKVREWLNNYDLANDSIEMLVDPDTAEYPEWVLPTYHDVKLYGGGTRREIDHHWSTEYCQEHVSIGYVIDIPAFMRAHKVAGKYRALYNAAIRGEITAQVTTDRGHEQYDIMDIDERYLPYQSDCPDNPLWPQLETVREMLESDMQSRIDTLSRQLHDELEYQASDEVITETCDANDYRFTETGEPV
jgi:hypothetical protein